MKKIRKQGENKVKRLMVESIIGFFVKIAILATVIWFACFHGIMLTDPLEVAVGFMFAVPGFTLGTVFIFDKSKEKFALKYKNIKRETARRCRRYKRLAA